MKTTTCISFIHTQLLLLMNWHCAHQIWHLHPCQRCHCWLNVSGFTSLILCNSRIHWFRCSSSQIKELLQPTPHQSIPPISNWGIWMFTKTSQCVFTWLCQCHLELARARKPSFFCLDDLFLTKNLNHIAKDLSIFHPKFGGSCRPHCFSTSTPSRHTSHYHNWPITNG
jgi:hypothetical protein